MKCREDLCQHCWKMMALRDYKGRVWGRYCLEAVQGALDGLFCGPLNDVSCFEPRHTNSVEKMKKVAAFYQLVKDGKI